MAKKDMGACMREWKSKHPQGRANKKMSKKQSHKQAVAACLNKTGLSEKFGLTFKEYLVEMDDFGGTDARSYIRSLPMYQELIKVPQAKPDALMLARSLSDEFGGQEMSRNVRDYIADEFDDLYQRTIGKHGANVGDWKGERDYQDRSDLERKLGAASDRWEQEIGTDAETGEPLPPRDARGRVRHGARVGMDFRPEIKSARIARELRGHGDVSSEIEKRANATPRGEGAYYGGESKAKAALPIIVNGLRAGKRPSEIKAQLRQELDMTAAGANTYFYKYKKMA